MLQIDISANVRRKFGKGAARTLRRSGLTPAILYGNHVDSISLELDSKRLTRELLALERHNAIINLDVVDEGTTTKRHVIVKAVQTDPISDALIHADFYEVSLDSPRHFTVPVNYTGKSAGVEIGGELVVNMNCIEVQGKILDIPNEVTVDITALGIGDKVTCGDIVISDDVTLVSKSDAICVHIQTPKVAVEETKEQAAGKK